MTDFDSMSDDEIRAWAEAERSKSLAQFADQPMPEISRVKKADYPHLDFLGFAFNLRPGGDIAVWRGDGAPVRGTMDGLRRAGRQVVLGVTLPDTTAWVLTRTTGEPWAKTTDTPSTTVPDILVDVIATPADASGRSEQWVVRTKRVNEVEGLPA